MKRGDLDKLKRLDPRLAAQLEGVLARRAKPDASAEPPEGPCAASEAQASRWDPHRCSAGEGAPESVCESEAPCPVPSDAETPPETSVSAPGPTPAASAESRAESVCAEPTEPARAPAHSFVDAYAQVGLPETPQTLVPTEASPDEKLAETWEGYEDDHVPPEELERRRAERAAEREAQRARDRAHCAQLGFFPGAHYRRRGTGQHVSCEVLELQLDGIDRRAGRASTWAEGHAAVQTMADVEAQSFTVRDLGDRADSMPSGLRGVFQSLTPSQRVLLRAVVTAYMGGALGLYEYQPVLASDLEMSERTMRYALNGGAGRPPGLVELGLVKRRQTWKPGVGERPSDHHYLLLQAGPALAEMLLPLMCMTRAKYGHRIPRRSGYTRTSARRAAAAGRQTARRTRFRSAEQAIRRRNGEATERRTELPRERRRPVPKRAQIPELNCPAQIADNPVPPPTGEGGLRVGRGRPPSPPDLNESLRDETFAPATPSQPRPHASDPLPQPHTSLRDRARALDGSAQAGPDLDYWRRRKQRGASIPDNIEDQLKRELFANLGAVIWG